MLKYYFRSYLIRLITAFQQRRKTLRNSFKIFNLSDALKADDLFNKRPEQLSVNAFIELTLKIEGDLKQ